MPRCTEPGGPYRTASARAPVAPSEMVADREGMALLLLTAGLAAVPVLTTLLAGAAFGREASCALIVVLLSGAGAIEEWRSTRRPERRGEMLAGGRPPP